MSPQVESQRASLTLTFSASRTMGINVYSIVNITASQGGARAKARLGIRKMTENEKRENIKRVYIV